jgi:hypothetical protein
MARQLIFVSFFIMCLGSCGGLPRALNMNNLTTDVWKQWRFQMMAYFGAAHSDIADDLVKAEAFA